MIVLDATAFSLLVNPASKGPRDPSTNEPVPKARERFLHLEVTLGRTNDRIVIPTPALAEVLVSLGDEAPAVLDRISGSSRFKIVPFDTIAAVELAAMTREALRAGDKRGGSLSDWQKVKIDRQIVAIAKVSRAQTIYSDDAGLATFARAAGLTVVETWNMPLPESEPPSLFD